VAIQNYSILLLHYKPTRWERLPFLSITWELLCFNTDTHNTESWFEQYRCWRDTTPGSCITKQRSKRCFLLFQSDTNYYVSIQTLTTLNLESNEIGTEGARHMAHALQSNAVREVSFFVNYIRTIMFQYRRSPHCILIVMKSVLRERNTWLMHYKATWWETFPSHHSHMN
jgi:hypothetical protein